MNALANIRLSAEQRTALRRAIAANSAWDAYRREHGITTADLTSSRCLEVAARFNINVHEVIANMPAPIEATPIVDLAPVATPAAPLAADKAKALELLSGLLTPQIDRAQIEAIVDAKFADIANDVSERVAKAIEGIEPRVLQIKVADKPVVNLEGHKHPIFEDLLSLVAQGANVMLKGPAGCGKTHVSGMVAKALGRKHGSISGSAGVSEAQIVGRLLPTGENGRFVYTKSPFVEIYENGGVFLFDEMDAFDANCLISINSATANGGFDIEARASAGLDTFVQRHEDTCLIAATNTFGTGADAMYVGRAQLDGATLDRWYTLEMDYDKAFEVTLANDKIVNFVWHLRDVIGANRFRRIASTRSIQRAAMGVNAGRSWAQVQQDLVVHWTVEEKRKIAFNAYA
jgi:cobaltochelatase CobS